MSYQNITIVMSEHTTNALHSSWKPLAYCKYRNRFLNELQNHKEAKSSECSEEYVMQVSCEDTCAAPESALRRLRDGMEARRSVFMFLLGKALGLSEITKLL
jgi:hypothetical protein